MQEFLVSDVVLSSSHVPGGCSNYKTLHFLNTFCRFLECQGSVFVWNDWSFCNFPAVSMGGIESRFNALLVEGKADDAMETWTANLELQTRLQPNAQIKSSPYRDTPLHCSVRWEMKELMLEFLTRGGDPLATNGIGETPIHIVCRAGDSKISSRRCRKRADVLQLMLDRIPSEESFDSNSVDRTKLGDSLLKSFKDKMTNGERVKVTADRDTHRLGAQDKVRSFQGYFSCRLKRTRGQPISSYLLQVTS